MITKNTIREMVSELSKFRYVDKNFNDSIHWTHIRKFEADLMDKLDS